MSRMYSFEVSLSIWIQVIPNKNKKIEFFHDYKVGLYWINDEINSNQKNKENEKKEIDVIGVLPKSYGVKTTQRRRIHKRDCRIF